MQDLFRIGDKLTRQGLNNIPRATLRMIRPGPGIRIMPTGDGISIATEPSQRPFFGGGDGSQLTRVLELPALPVTAAGEVRVFWLNAAQGLAEFGEAGTGDNQEWKCIYPQDRYYPMEKYTTLSGVPV